MKKSFLKIEKKLKKVWKNEKMFLESSRIWCPKIMTWKKHLSRPQKVKSDQQPQQQIYVKDPELERSWSKIENVFL